MCAQLKSGLTLAVVLLAAACGPQDLKPDAGSTTDAGLADAGSCVAREPIIAQRMVANFLTEADYQYTQGWGLTSASDPSDLVRMEVIWRINTVETNVTLGTRDLALEPNYNGCLFCLVLELDCFPAVPAPMCSGGVFVAREGSMTVTSSPRSDMGQFTGTATDVVFREWDYDTDTAVGGGRCITVPSISIDVPITP